MVQYGSEKVLPYNEEEVKGKQVRRMFDAIAGKYDFLNHTLSLGFDKGWRRKGIRFLKPFHPEVILDLATGTGDLAIQMYRSLAPKSVVGADISEGMMAVGRDKVRQEGLSDVISFDYQDAMELTYPDCSFDAVTAAFGIRNYEDIEQGLSEMYRVLKPGGCLMVLELSTPEYFPMRQLYQLYSTIVIPTVGRLFSKERNAYNYLPASIRQFPQGEVMKALLTKIGFVNADVKTFTFGICSMYTGIKE
ncbi:bifunctional demethylmenaquinone methyltransferase/2-methoxy-6-polyprenyl-1,4-benzoquinol methylase UbiE [Parabacteroides sp. OttesenSCG-928-G21]|nr:bifunctional demethylmenaquinone methyltransferase/2-methoxy-6-polyprenyl-1,4-benzoquinol methylase UbiE [Parabacteroides sp. OttesenSCG-928-G21]